MVKRLWKRGWIPALIIMGAGFYLFSVSWLRWGSLLIDTGRELYLPLSILSGKLPYRDIFYEFGPFSPYFNSLLCMIFGVHMRAFIISGALTATLMCVLLYKTSRIFLNALFSTLCVLTFLFVFAFSQHYEAGIFNYIIPYSYASIHAITLAFLALFFYYRSRTYFSSLFIALLLITRVEIGIVLMVSIFIGIILDSQKQDRLKRVAAYCLFPALAAAIVYGFFGIITGSTVASKEALLINLDIKGPFTGQTLGTIDFWRNIAAILKTSLYYVAMSAVFFASGRLISLVKKISTTKKVLIGIGVTLVVAATTVLFQKEFFHYNAQYRCVPIVCILVFIVSCRRYFAKKDRQDLFLAVFSIFSLLLLARMFFNVRAEHSGFYLLAPGMLCYYIFFLRIVPRISQRKDTRAFYRFAFTVLSISFIMAHVPVSLYRYKNRTMKISSPRGAMLVHPGYYRCKQLVEYLRKNTDPSDKLAVFPEGLTINFLSERDSPLHQYAFLPLLISLTPDCEKNLSKELEDKDVKYVVILRRLTSEYGAARFGMDYAQDIMRYLADHYVIEKQFGPWPFTSNEFSLVLLKRL
ncbi:MAG: hypothetical protein P9L93_02335 [Candidatus Gorgyraea atricola]|nr:hypothetical protein [Candidatus Gorgyraea atricola]